ncbi:ADP-ribose pyrophosphatase [Thermoflexales bacterium]|nr:ADP-ribose pyrophosphatase [Thermoflexales bacterium]
MKPAEQIALWADKLRDVSAMGLMFVKSVYDETAYRAVQTIALEMLALASGESLEAIEPLRTTIFSNPTPLSCGDAAIIADDGRILLVQRADNGLWAMPGGAFEVGETPAEGAAREALEETGIHCQPITLVGVFDSRHCGMKTRHHLYAFLFLCKPLAEPSENPSHAIEVLRTGWFAEGDLPEEIDPGHRTRIPEAFRVWHGDRRAFFDK